MRIFLRCAAGLIFCVFIAILFMPPIIGVVLQHYSPSTFLEDSRYFKVELLSYERGWFSSDITFKVKATPEFSAKLQSYSPTVPLPLNLECVVKGHLQQGPIFYSPSPNHPPVGLALMTRRIIPTLEQRALFNALDADSNLIKHNTSYLSFLGQYTNTFETQRMRVMTQEGMRIEFNHFKAAIGSFNHTIQGQINLNDLWVGDDNTTILLPALTVHLDLQKTSGLWLGDQSISIPKIDIIDAGELFNISRVEFTGALREKAGLLYGDRYLSIHSIKFNDQIIGPIQLRISINKLNARVISDLIDTYKEIMAHGEMYESQLKQKLLSMVPGMIGPDSALSLDKLVIQTQEGAFLLDAKVSWPANSFSPQSTVQDLSELATLKIGLKISEPLVNRIIKLLAKLTYIYQIPNEERQRLVELQNNIHLATQINAYSIIDLVNAGKIPREEGIDLLVKIRNNISLDDYLREIKTLLLSRKINIVTAYELNFLYLMLYQQYNELDRRVVLQEQHTEQLIRHQFDQYLKEGFIVRDNGNYTMSLMRNKSQFIVNGNQRSGLNKF